MQIIGLQCHEKDNVAVIFAEQVKAGMAVTVKNKKGMETEVLLNDDVPFGHKVAIRHIGIGEPVIKYGEEIGVATEDISTGDYVHVHNLDSQRARGDLEKEE